MFSTIAAARACDRLEGTFRPLLARSGPRRITGVLWIEGCRAAARSGALELELSGRGWQWVETSRDKAGATFTVAQYVRFRPTVQVEGTIDVAYSTANHIATIWFSLTDDPVVRVAAIGNVSVDEEGAWAEVVGAAATLFAADPDDTADDRVSAVAADALRARLRKGFAATVDLCTGETRTGLGHPKQGEMLDAADPSSWQEAEIHAGGYLFDGPHGAGTEIHVRTDDRISAGAVCADDAARIADLYLDGRPVDTRTLAVSTGESRTIDVPTECASVLVVHADADARLQWRVEEPAAVDAPLADCE